MIDSIMLVIGFVTASVSVFLAYRQGIKDGRKLSENKPIEPIVNIPSIPHPIPKEQKAEIDRINAISRNIDAYNGTTKGQRKVN